MAFDIHQKIFDADGLPLERAAEEYKNKLVDLFEQSPEGQALREEGFHGRWTGIMLDLGQNYLDLTPPKMSAKDIREILFDLIPLKISALAEQAPEIIRELQAFWRFLQREVGPRYLVDAQRTPFRSRTTGFLGVVVLCRDLVQGRPLFL